MIDVDIIFELCQVLRLHMYLSMSVVPSSFATPVFERTHSGHTAAIGKAERMAHQTASMQP